MCTREKGKTLVEKFWNKKIFSNRFLPLVCLKFIQREREREKRKQQKKSMISIFRRFFFTSPRKKERKKAKKSFSSTFTCHSIHSMVVADTIIYGLRLEVDFFIAPINLRNVMKAESLIVPQRKKEKSFSNFICIDGSEIFLLIFKSLHNYQTNEKQ